MIETIPLTSISQKTNKYLSGNKKIIWKSSLEKDHNMFHIVLFFDPSFSFCEKTIVVFLCFYFPPVYSALNSDVPRDPVVNADKAANLLLIREEKSFLLYKGTMDIYDIAL